MLDQIPQDAPRKLFDPTISLGTLITIGVFIFTLYRFHMANVHRFNKLEYRVNLMWSKFKRRFGMDDVDDSEIMGDD